MENNCGNMFKVNTKYRKSQKKIQMSATDQKVERGSFTVAVRCTSIQTTS